MKQVIQRVSGGKTDVVEVPVPLCGPHELLVLNCCSLISAGTERSVIKLAQSSLLQKALARPKQVRRVWEKIKKEGLVTTFGQVQAKLGDWLGLGYSSAGVVVACGEHVQQFKPMDRVAVAGPHAHLVAVSERLCARVPDSISDESACYAGVGAIAMQGVRLAEVPLGSKVGVIGLGLIGKLCVGLLRAQGCQVLGFDLNPDMFEAAQRMGTQHTSAKLDLNLVQRFTEGLGLDAVLLCVATDANEPIEFAAEACMRGGRVVLVGVSGTHIPRDPFFKKELIFRVSSSMGAGRWDSVYENDGIDYPAGYARWTVQRNMQAVIDTMQPKSGHGFCPELLTKSRASVVQAQDMYDRLSDSELKGSGLVLTYPELESSEFEEKNAVEESSHDIGASSATAPFFGSNQMNMGVVGAGNFARLILLPILKKVSGLHLHTVVSARGMSASLVKQSHQFAHADSDPNTLFENPEIHSVAILSRHSSHARLVQRALGRGKHVFVEKPLCVSFEELRDIDQTIHALGSRCPVLMVGHNRRWAPGLRQIHDAFSNRSPARVPEMVSVRFVCGELPLDSWPHAAKEGGRFVGEACHAIDICVFLIGSPIVGVTAMSATMEAGRLSSDDRCTAVFQHANGSISQVQYIAGGDRAGPKERVEVFGEGTTAWLEDFKHGEIWSSGKCTNIDGKKDKGHAAQIDAFTHAVREPSHVWPVTWESLRSVMWATLAVRRAVRTADVVQWQTGIGEQTDRMGDDSGSKSIEESSAAEPSEHSLAS